MEAEAITGVPRLMELYNKTLSSGDPRLKDWLFVESPVASIVAMLVYFAVCLVGPKLMRNRKPLNLGHALTVYNFLLVGLSSYMTYEFFMSAFLAGYSLSCQTVDYSQDPLALRMTSVCWVYFISKFIETTDTLFFILRKKNGQITFLHVFHHGTMIFNWWLCVKYVPGGATFFHAMINSFVHVIMYSYYGLSALGPWIQPYLWWKKYVTKMQVVQFFVVLVHSLNITRCDFPFGFAQLSSGYAVCMILLFGNFYYQEFVRRAKAKEQLTRDSNSKHMQLQPSAHDIKQRKIQKRTKKTNGVASVDHNSKVVANGNGYNNNNVVRKPHFE